MKLYLLIILNVIFLFRCNVSYLIPKRPYIYSFCSIDSETNTFELDTENINKFVNDINKLKYNGLFKKWSSVDLNYTSISKTDLYMSTRTSFSSQNYLDDLINAAQNTNLIDKNMILSMIGLVLTDSILLPQATFLPVLLRNVIGIISLSIPFLLLSLSVISPDTLNSLKRIYNKPDIKKEKDRIIYHEAGHFLVGYLCGVPILQYDVSGEKDAGTVIDLPTDLSANRFAILMVVAIAGVVAETLRFGDSKGGAQDLPVIYDVID